MPVYIYKAVDSQGKHVRGEMESSSEINLLTELAKKGYLPLNISFKTRPRDLSFLKLKKPGLSVDPRALIIFTRQFATIIKAAVPIMEGLGILSEQAEDPVLRKALAQIRSEVESGSSLSQAMSKHPGVFSQLYVNTIVAGESAGVLPKVLMQLSSLLEDEMENKTNIISALRYPVMVVIAMIIAVIVLSTMVIPQFARIYETANMSLPLPTQVMIAISNIILGPWKDSPNHFLKLLWFVLLAGACGVLFIAVLVAVNTKPGRWWWDGIKFRVPILGKLYTKITMLRFASMLNVLYQSGLPVLKTMDIVGLTIGNVVLSKEIEQIKQDVSDGKGISGAVMNSAFFPRLVAYMISIGEKSGSLPAMLDSLCDYFELDVKTTIKDLTGLIEPLMTVVLGSVVMGMALAIFLPLWNMIRVFKSAG